MATANELLRQGRDEELWKMCCGFLSLDLPSFMAVQKRLLLEQINLLNNSPIGHKILGGIRPTTVEEFRRRVPLTTYADYCPELLQKREDVLPVKPAMWVHSSGRSSEYPQKWVPMSPRYAREMSSIAYGLGILSSCEDWGDVSRIPLLPKFIYAVAPRPYVSGAMASLVSLQTPTRYMPPIEQAERMSFEDRIALGFRQALDQGFDFFFGLSLVLVVVGGKFSHASSTSNILPLLAHPRSLFRLGKGMARSKLAGRPLLPRDLWSVRGIICSGLDSWVYRDQIKEIWGRYPLDTYASTEGGFMATQTWDHEGMTFIPTLNFFEFIPEIEHLKWQLDRSYQPKTLLLDEVRPGEAYEIVITSLHGGAMVRYRIGDVIRIASPGNEKLGIRTPQMVFEKRTDDIIDFVVVKLTEKQVWQAIEKTTIPYEDWTAYKKPGEQILRLLIEPKNGFSHDPAALGGMVRDQLVNNHHRSPSEDWRNGVAFDVEVTLLPAGSFTRYKEQRQAEGADLAHVKPPHLNPSEKVLAQLLGATPDKVRVKAPVEERKDRIAV